nr:related to REM1 protein [imported] - Neurospora crassa [Neurospora crassa]
MGLTYIDEQVVDNEWNHGISLHSDYALQQTKYHNGVEKIELGVYPEFLASRSDDKLFPMSEARQSKIADSQMDAELSTPKPNWSRRHTDADLASDCTLRAGPTPLDGGKSTPDFDR